MPTFTDESRKSWITNGEIVKTEEIRIGCFQRIASAVELMAKDRIILERDLEFYKRKYDEGVAHRLRLLHQIRGLKGTITRMRRKEGVE